MPHAMKAQGLDCRHILKASLATRFVFVEVCSASPRAFQLHVPVGSVVNSIGTTSAEMGLQIVDW